MIYLDYAANYPAKKEVLDTLVEVELNYYGNYNSSHKLGIKSKEKYNELNNKIKDILSLDDNYSIIYTSSATEANNLAIKGICSSYSGFGKKILVSELEHSSINGTLGYLKDNGFIVEFIKTLNNGQIDLNDLKEKLTNDVILVCVILVDGETGLMHDYKKISDVIKTSKNAHFLVDATQAIGKFKLDFSYLELVSFAPHKFGGIIGSGCLIKRKNTILTPLFHGGESDSIYRSGTVPLGIIASIEKALELAYSSLDENYIKVNNINKYILNELNKINKIKINSFTNPYIINISIDGFLSRQSVDFLNEHDICVSQKSACSIKNTPSKIIMAIYKDKKRASSSFRISLSELVTIEEAEQLIKVIKELIK